MKCAIISVSEQGAKLGALIASRLQADTTLYERKERQSSEPAIYFTRTAALTADIFNEYDALVYVMAIGIVVRSIAPHLQDKTRDPAVIVLDELGLHTISLLSGHLGGANELAMQIAESIQSDPVITTATDVHGYPAPDVLARHIGATVEPLAALKPVNGAVARGEKVIYFLDERMPLAHEIREIAKKDGITCYDMSQREAFDYAAEVLITDRLDVQAKGVYVFLRPPTLVAGMGCRRDTSTALLDNAVEEACQEVGRSPLSIAAFASVTLKQDEKGLLAMVTRRRKKIYFYEPAKLENIVKEYGLEESEFVKKTIGVGNICETTAILKAGTNQLILRKTKYPQTTIALVEVASL